MVGIDDIRKAHERIRPHIHRTPVMTSRTLDRMAGGRVLLKCENYQRGGAFKARGAFNFLLSLTEEERRRGVIAHSSGNHAQAVALAASELGVKAIIVMPRDAPLVKAEATKGYGAEIVWAGEGPDERRKLCYELASEKGYTVMPPFDDERIIAGAGTAALELIEEAGTIDLLFCPIGGGGLISGNSIATKALCPDARVLGVEPEGADDAFRGLRDGRRYPSTNPRTIADGLRTSLSDLTFSIIREKVDEIVLVPDAAIVEVMRLLWERMKMVVEPSGAVSVAGLIRYSREKGAAGLEGRKAGAIISGGNVDLDDLFDRY